MYIYLRFPLFRPDSVSLANYKYFTLPRRISINIAPKVGMFPEAEGRGKYSLPRVDYISIGVDYISIWAEYISIGVEYISIGVDYISIFNPNHPPMVLGMLVGCVTTDTSSSN